MRGHVVDRIKLNRSATAESQAPFQPVADGAGIVSGTIGIGNIREPLQVILGIKDKRTAATIGDSELKPVGFGPLKVRSTKGISNILICGKVKLWIKD
jgi:hypothetical protein